MNIFNENRMYRLMMIILIIMSCSIVYSFYLRFYPFRTLEVDHVEVLTPEVPVGGVFRYKVGYCRYTDVVSTAYRTFINVNNQSIRYPQPVSEGISVEGCHTVERMVTLVDIPPGEYYLRTIASYELESQTRKVQFITPNFKVK